MGARGQIVSQGDGAVVAVLSPAGRVGPRHVPLQALGTSKGDHILLLLPPHVPGVQVCGVVFFLLGLGMRGQSQEDWKPYLLVSLFL